MATENSGLLRWSNILAFALVVIVNGIAGSTTLLGGNNTAAISDANPTLLTPAGYVFSIWGVVYILLGVFVVFQALPSQREKSYHGRIGWLFVLSSALNILWLFAWQYESLIVSVVLMFLLLISLILIYLRLDIGKVKVERLEKLAIHLPFSVYLGWITIATIANVSSALVSYDWSGFGVSPETWAILVASVVLIIAILVAAIRKDVAYEMAILWAFVGIAVKQSLNDTIVYLIVMGSVIVLIALVVSLVFARTRTTGKSSI